MMRPLLVLAAAQAMVAPVSSLVQNNLLSGSKISHIVQAPRVRLSIRSQSTAVAAPAPVAFPRDNVEKSTDEG